MKNRRFTAFRRSSLHSRFHEADRSRHGAVSGALIAGSCIAIASSQLACGQQATHDATNLQPYHPLADGASWTYQHESWTEQVTMTATSLNGEAAYSLVSSPNPKNDVRSEAMLVQRGGRVLRVAEQDFVAPPDTEATLKSSVDYGAGFTRFDEGWAQQAPGFSEVPEYQRVVTLPGSAAQDPQARRHTFEILSLSEQVTTPAGTFDCMKIRRTKDWQADARGIDASDATPKIFWYARGVGKVRELNLDSGKGELLVDYSIPSLSIPSVSPASADQL